MKINKREFTAKDLVSIRDFLVDSYKEIGRPYNWTIERLNFALSLDRVMNGVAMEDWEKRVSIWESDGEMIGVVTTEGNGSNWFFQLKQKDISKSLLEKMFDHVEQNFPINDEGELLYEVQLRIPGGDELREGMAQERGYEKSTKWHEVISILDIDKRPNPGLPDGFIIKDGDQVTDQEKGIAHAKAFDYLGTLYDKRSPVGYEIMRNMPDYRSDLDLYVVSEETGEIVSFCTIWYDRENRIGILEPVGTHPEFRRRGLARAVIAEGIDRIASEGAKEAHVGSSQEFYKAIGFEERYSNFIWKKTIGEGK